MGKCTKCGTNFVGTPEQPAQDGLCKYCEIEELKAANSKLRKALVKLVGADTATELDAMEMLLRTGVLPVPEDDRAAAIDGICALRATLPA